MRRWGRFHFNTLTLEEHHNEEAGDDELLDLAAMQTVTHGGTVYGVKPEELPDTHSVAAIYRF